MCQCPQRERFGYGGDPLGCGEAGLSIYDWSTFYPKRVQDFNDAQTVDPASGKPAAFPETSPFVGIRCGGCGADGGFDGDLPDFPSAGGPIGWQTYQPVTQLWLYKYYGDQKTMSESYEKTYAWVQVRLSLAGHDCNNVLPTLMTLSLTNQPHRLPADAGGVGGRPRIDIHQRRSR